MTRRERSERRIERRLDWAEGREAKAAALLKQNEPFRGDIAFSTQPGHIPERARVIARDDHAYAHHKMATHHKAMASGAQAQLKRTIFSDDANAIEALRAKIAKLEVHAELTNRVNKAWRKSKGTPGWGDGLGLSQTLLDTVAETMRLCPWLRAPMDATSDRAEIRRCCQRITQIEALAQQSNVEVFS